MHRIVSVLLIGLVIAGCAMQSVEPDPSPTVLEQWSGIQGGSAEASTLVVRGLQEWRALWRQVGREAPREFDGARHIAVAIFMGHRSTGGFSIEITEIRQDRGSLRIEYRERGPRPGMKVTQVITSPWAILMVLAPNKSTQISFVRLNSRHQQ